MPIPMVNLIEFSQAVALLDRIASPPVVDRALRGIGLKRKVLTGEPGFLPYRMEAMFIESVARLLGDPHLGARLGQAFDYSTYHGYRDYVFGAPNLAMALRRAQMALPLIHPGSDTVLRRTGNDLVLAFNSGLAPEIRSPHLDHGTIIVMTHVFKHFLGLSWRPEWIEVAGDEYTHPASLTDIIGAPVRVGAALPALAFQAKDLLAPNPAPPGPGAIPTLSDLPSLMGIARPRTMEDAVIEVLRVLLRIGDLSEDAVAQRLTIGSRTLQRALKSEGRSFRDIKARFLEARARALLADSELPIDDIARVIGYTEPNNFRRAFKNWTSFSPGAYRAEAARRANTPG